MSIRIVVCLDVEAATPRDAYALLYKRLQTLHPEIDWESTDEWFDADGMLLDEDVIEEARHATLYRPLLESSDGP